MKNIPRSLIEDQTYCVNYLVYQNEKGVREFIYIAVRQDNMDNFKDAVKRGNFDAEDYGIVLEDGRGEASDELKATMKMLYKCDHKNAVSVFDYNPEHG